MSNPHSESRPERHKPETLRLRTLTPEITVADLEASLNWYCDAVGFVVVQKWEKDGNITGAVVEAGRIRLFLVQKRRASIEPHPDTLQFRCSSAQEIDSLAAAIESRGVVLDKPLAAEAWGARSFELLDPDGVRLTISSATAQR